MKKVLLAMMLFLAAWPVLAANKYDNPDTLVVSRDGTGEFRTIDEAIEVCRAFMDYTKVIYVKKECIRKSSSSHRGSPTSPSVVKTVTTPSLRGMTMPTSRCQ